MQTQNTTSTYNFYTDFNNFKDFQSEQDWFDEGYGMYLDESYEWFDFSIDIEEFLSQFIKYPAEEVGVYEHINKYLGVFPKNSEIRFDFSYGYYDHFNLVGYMESDNVKTLIERLYPEDKEKQDAVFFLFEKYSEIEGYISFGKIPSDHRHQFSSDTYLGFGSYNITCSEETDFFDEDYDYKEDWFFTGDERLYYSALFDEFLQKANAFLEEFQEAMFKIGQGYVDDFYDTKDNVRKMKVQWDVLQKEKLNAAIIACKDHTCGKIYENIEFIEQYINERIH